MNEGPSFDNMQRALLEVLSVAEVTGARGVTMVCLILCYSAIDTLAWLAAEHDNEPVGQRYRRWVQRYMLPAVPALKCTAEELYAARCAMLHTMTADSDVHARKRLRVVVYAWGPVPAEALQTAIDGSEAKGRCLAVHLSALTEGARFGCAQMFEDAEGDPRLRARIQSKVDKFFEGYRPSDLGMAK
jgi:hypothetical protein